MFMWSHTVKTCLLGQALKPIGKTNFGFSVKPAEPSATRSYGTLMNFIVLSFSTLKLTAGLIVAAGRARRLQRA